MESVVAVEDLVVAYDGQQAVKKVNLSVMRGEHLTLLGPSGCGKTTTLRSIAGLETPVSGRIIIDGTVVYDSAAGINLPPERRGLSMVFQSYAIWPHMSVFDNVAFGLTVRGAGKEEKRAAVERSLALVDLAEYAERPATSLSGGQQQRVALARAIAFDSKVILLDEPLSNLDARLRATMRTELKLLQRRLGFTSIYVTHDQEEALALSDRIIIMRSGVIEQEGTPEQIYFTPRTRFAAEFLGAGNILRCRAVRDPGGSGRFFAEIAADIRIEVGAANVAGEGDAWVSFRPMNVSLASEPDGASGGWHRGKIRSRVFLGDVTHFIIQAGPAEICAHGAAAIPLGEGADVWWRVLPGSAFLLSN